MQGKEGILAMEWKVLLIVLALEKSASQMLFCEILHILL